MMREKASDFLRHFLRELDSYRDVPEPSLSIIEVLFYQKIFTVLLIGFHDICH